MIKDIARKGFFNLISAKVLIKILGFGSQIFVVKLLSPVELGQIKTLQTITGIALLVAIFGFNTAILKLCSEKREIGEKYFIYKKNMKYTIISTISVLIILFVLAKLKILSPDKEINNLIPIFMLTIPAGVIVNLIMSYLQSLKQIKKMANAQIYYRVFSIFVLLALTYFWGMTGFIASVIISGYLFLPYIRRYTKEYTNESKVVENVFKKSFHFAGWSMSANTVNNLGQQMDILLLNFLILDREAFGYYTVAIIFLLPLREAIKAVRDIALPYFSEKQDNKKEFYRVLNKYRRLLLILAILISLFSIFIVPFIIEFFFGELYSVVPVYFSILIIGFIFRSYSSLISTAVIAVGKMKYNFYSSALYVPISLLLNYTFILEFGIKGAAIAQSSSAFLAMLFIIFISKKGLREHFNELKSAKIII